MSLRDRLIRHEGLRLFPYNCTAGKLTLGVGRNIQDRGISEKEAYYLLDNDIQAVQRDVAKFLSWTAGLDEVRRSVLEEMAFQLGVTRLLGFKNMLTSVRAGNWKKASEEMLDSKWAQQTPARVKTLARIMETGVDPG